MTVSRRKGDAGFSDMLFSRLVRHRGYCERCRLEGVPMDTAHIIRRGYSATRCLERNAWCLCRACHRKTGEDPAEFMDLVEKTIGRAAYDELRLMANQGITLSSKVFWRLERARLEARCRELGLSPKRNPEAA